MKVFDARYPGECSACPERIEVGDKLAVVDGQVMHFEDVCDETPLRPKAICPGCFEELPVSGVCGTC